MGKAIVDYIPVGRENAVTRRQLCELTGMRDRALRNAVVPQQFYPVFDAIRKEMEEENEGIQGIQ